MPGASEFEDRITWTELLQKVPPAEWVLDMIRYRRLHGRYRASDLDRLLGPINKCVEWRPQRTLLEALGLASPSAEAEQPPAPEPAASERGVDFGGGEGI